MAIRSRKFKKFLYIVMFLICMLSFLSAIVALVGASTLNSISNYMDPYFLTSHGYGSFEEFLRDSKLHLAMDPASVEHQLELWTVAGIGAAVLALMSLIYLVAAVGDRDSTGKIYISRFDKVPGEIQLAAISAIFFGGGGLFLVFVEDVVASIYGYGYLKTGFEMTLSVAATVAIGFSAAALGLALILSNAKKVKANHWLDNTIVGWLFNKLYREVGKGGSLMKKVVFTAIIICVMSATVYLAPVALVLILVFVPKLVHQYEAIKTGVQAVNDGDLEYKIPPQGDGEFGQLAEGINEMTGAINLAAQNEMRTQRMKTDLISNVSHDLKTPLTSIVNYVDLLKQENLTPQQRKSYLDILSQKTERLCQLTEDLFEAAKASSGAMPVEMTSLDFVSLLNQSLGEMNERVERSGLDFVINYPEDKFFVYADGRLLWRVISNLLSNVLKYSQDNTRVYIDFYRNGSMVTMEMKNISRQSLNVDPETLMERFKRGDESRTIEGSGLGLTIAKDLMKLMDGRIELAIDGDLFKAMVSLEEAEAPEDLLLGFSEEDNRNEDKIDE
ncbi:MAG: HAMP domain-containing histidine kinase [Firmicutes bacterium]|nr:HAMP domain-containing histidine kinase [Bacillota bacterium]